MFQVGLAPDEISKKEQEIDSFADFEESAILNIHQSSMKRSIYRRQKYSPSVTNKMDQVVIYIGEVKAAFKMAIDNLNLQKDPGLSQRYDNYLDFAIQISLHI